MGHRRLDPKSKLLKRPEQFCKDHGLSPAKYKMMCAKGVGPHLTYIGQHSFIHIDDEEAWIQMMRNPTSEPAATYRAETIANLKARASKGGRATAVVNRTAAEARRKASNE